MSFLKGLDPTLLGTLATGVFGYLAARAQTALEKRKQKDTNKVEERRLLSEDEKEFRAALMEEFRRNREQMSILQDQNDELVVHNVDLRKKIVELQTQNNNLIIEVNKIRAENQALLERMTDNGSEEENTQAQEA